MPDELRTIRERFLVGGFSFNSLKASADESRRIELRVEFRDLDESAQARPPKVSGDHEACPI